MSVTTEKPISWREFRNAKVSDIKPGDLVLLDPVYGVAHIIEIRELEIARSYEKARQLIGEVRGLDFPGLSGDPEHFEERRFVQGSWIRDEREPILIVHVVKKKARTA